MKQLWPVLYLLLGTLTVAQNQRLQTGLLLDDVYLEQQAFLSVLLGDEDVPAFLKIPDHLS